MKHKALSIHQPHVRLIMQGRKTGELRSRRTNYRGDVIICSTKKKFGDPKKYPLGMGMCIVELFDCVPAEEIHRRQIYPDPDIYEQKGQIRGYLWKLRNPRVINPFPVKGQQGFFYLDVDMNKLDPEPIHGGFASAHLADEKIEDPPIVKFMIAVILIFLMAIAIVVLFSYIF